MDVKKFHKTATDACQSLIQNVFSRISSEAVIKTAVRPANFIISYVISQGILLGSISPFGLAFSAASAASSGSLFALIGGVFGYLGVLDKINSLKYIACLILIYTAHFVFKGTSLTKSRLFTPCSVLVPTLCINLVFLADGGFAFLDTVISLTEIIIATASAYLFVSLRRFKLRTISDSPRFFLALLVFSSALLIPLFKITLPGGISLGAVLTMALVSLTGFSAGCGIGCVTGAVIGCALALSESSADYCMMYSLIGISAGLFSKKGRVLCAAFVFFSAVSISCWTNPEAILKAIFESVCAILIFLLLGESFQKKTRCFFAEKSTKSDMHLRTYASERLSLVANAFSSLGNMLRDISPSDGASKDINPSSAFDRATKLLCKKCTLSKICWERDYSATRTALNDASDIVKKTGELSARDLPIYFSSRCIHIEKFVGTVNREFVLLRCNHHMKNKASESRRHLYRQYSEVSDVFSALASDIRENAKNDESAELKIRDTLSDHGILCDIAVYRDSEGHANVHLLGRDLEDVAKNFDKYKKPISSALGVAVDLPKYTRGSQLDDIVIREMPAFNARMSASVHRRAGSEVSGDSGSYFSPAPGKLSVILSDGMGSGREAAAESASSISLLESLLKSGISPKSALNTLNSALTLKAAQTGAFATLDLMYADMFTGSTDFFKFGSAPTYIKRGQQVRRITSSALPAGITTEKTVLADSTSISLIDGDFVIMASDGIADAKDDAWLCEIISKSEETSPKSLADEILAHALTKYGRADDMTVVVTRFERNPASDA